MINPKCKNCCYIKEIITPPDSQFGIPGYTVFMCSKYQTIPYIARSYEGLCGMQAEGFKIERANAPLQAI